jgi:hypothetical protein
VQSNTLTPALLQKMDAYWRAANYLSVGQIYLYDNPLLKEPLTLSHIKPLVVGHWGTTPGQCHPPGSRRGVGHCIRPIPRKPRSRFIAREAVRQSIVAAIWWCQFGSESRAPYRGWSGDAHSKCSASIGSSFDAFRAG